MRDDTVLVVGPGDLGRRVVDALARLPLGRVVVAGRNPDTAAAVAGQAALVAALTGGAGHVTSVTVDVADVDGTATMLGREEPSVVVMAASRHSWWRSPGRLAALPYGTWLPLQAVPVRDLMLARAAAGCPAPVVALPYPDAVGPVLAPAGLAPQIGAGNVGEVAAKLQVLAAARAGCGREEVDVRLVAHHAVEREAFGAFAALAGDDAPGGGGPPPARIRVTVRGAVLAEADARALLTAAHPILAGRETHALTAAATVAVVTALLGDTPALLHAPAPGGRPGGYPVRCSRAGIELALPDDWTEPDAIAANAVAARWDGIERITPEGEVVFTAAVTRAAQRLLGLDLERVAFGDLDVIADALERALRA